MRANQHHLRRLPGRAPTMQNQSPKIEVLTTLLNTARQLETHGTPSIAAAASSEAVQLQKRLASARAAEASNPTRDKAA